MMRENLEGKPFNFTSPTPRVSLQVKYAGPNDLNFELPINNIFSDTISVRLDASITETTNLILSVSITIYVVDQLVAKT